MSEKPNLFAKNPDKKPSTEAGYTLFWDPKRCAICGRFVSNEGHCKQVFWDDYTGAWEHA